MLSIVVPVYNDPDGIQTTLESLLSQTCTDYRILVVDNASSDRTPDVVRSYERVHDNLTLIYERDIHSSYAARNTGIRNTDSEIIGFVDADMTVPDTWLEAATRTFQIEGANYVGCDVKLIVPDNPSIMARYDHSTGFPMEEYLNSQQFAGAGCLFVRKAVFEEVGLFDYRLKSGGDKEFGNRVHDAGYELHFAPDNIVYHPTRNSLRSHIKKDARVGRGLCQLQRYHPNRYGHPGIPPRPSGIKRPKRTLPPKSRFAFSIISYLLTIARGVGYYREYLRGEPADLGDNIPEFGDVGDR